MATHTTRTRRLPDERGTALIIVLMATMLLTALSMTVILVTNTETAISGNYKNSSEALYAADAGVERAVQDLLVIADWNRILGANNTVPYRSSFMDASNCSGVVTMSGGGLANLTATKNVLQSETDTANLWGLNNPQWKPYACGHLTDLLPDEMIDSHYYVAVWVADDPSENDGDPTADTNGVLTLHAEAFGPMGSHKIVEVTVARTSSTEIERGQIAQRGQEELNQRARKAAVQTPGKGLIEMRMGTRTGGMVVQ
jgi:Tfp pilus assembly protein PilX